MQHNLKKRSAGVLPPKLTLHKAPINARHTGGRPERGRLSASVAVNFLDCYWEAEQRAIQYIYLECALRLQVLPQQYRSYGIKPRQNMQWDGILGS